MTRTRHAAVVTVGSELTRGLRIDTNTATIARRLASCGFEIEEAVSIADDAERLRATLHRLTATLELVIVTGGLGPTHDDITRQAASEALSLPLMRDASMVRYLEPYLELHHDAEAASHVLDQADVLAGARILPPTTGTAPGQVVPTPAGSLVLLPGPPAEMAPMLELALDSCQPTSVDSREFGVAQLSESDVQIRVQRAIAAFDDVGFTVLASPGDVRVLLTDEGCGPRQLEEAVDAAATSLGDHAYSFDERTLAQVVIAEAAARGVTLSVAESCTGGLVAAALTDVIGASEAFLGGVVSYSNAAKRDVLGVAATTLDQYGAVSQQAAAEMASGAVSRFGADLAVSVTGIAGPGGGTAEKPVGTVWFGIASREGSSVHLLDTDSATHAETRRDFRSGSRNAIRQRSTATALDLLRRALRGLPVR